MIRSEQIQRAYSYENYRKLLEELLLLEKTTGHDQSETMVGYTKLNVQRMSRIDKTLVLNEKTKETLRAVKGRFIWVVLTEGWCGDTAQSVPVLAAICRFNPNIELKLLLRDDNPEVMDQYLTNGARSIPKLICFEKKELKEMFTWGPRPAPLQALVMQMVKDLVPKDEKGLIVQKWYNADQTLTIQSEITQLVGRHMVS
jgi:hypothetical protein